MEPGSDLVEKLLQSTGLSCEDLLQRLQQYRSNITKDTEETTSELPHIGKQCNKSNDKDNCTVPNVDSGKKTNDTHHSDKPEGGKSQEKEVEKPSAVRKTLKNEDSTVVVAEVSKSKEKSPDGEDPTAIEKTQKKETVEVLALDKTSLVAETGKSEKKTTNEVKKATVELAKPVDCSKVPALDKSTPIREAANSEEKPSEELEKFPEKVERSAKAVECCKALLADGKSNENPSEKLEEPPEKVEETKAIFKEVTKPIECSKVAAAVKTTPSAEGGKSNENSSENLEMPPEEVELAKPVECSKELGTSDLKNLDKKSEDTPNDHNYSTNNEELQKSEDSIRDSLRMQLSSLRNMKKSCGYLPELKTTALFFHNLKKKRKSCDVNSSTENVTDDKVMTSSDSLVSLSDETNFLIVDVSGGVDRLKESGNEAETPNCYRKKKIASFESPQEMPNVSVRNISESFNRDPGIKRSVKNSEKSPFVSDSLEDFLNESAELRVSYPIPKLRAEEGIKESTKTSPFDDVVSKPSKTKGRTVQKEKQKVVKAKTLAEMRRQFEKLKANEQRTIKKQEVKRNLFNEVMVKNRTKSRNSFIFFNNKKLWMTSKYRDRCLGVVRSKHEEPEEVVPKKPSLLSGLAQNRSGKITYRPGPLSKKASLQSVDSRSHWMTEVKALPKIYLEVTPEAYKPIDPAVVHLLPTFDNPVVTEERAKFALSVLQPNTSNQESFSFHVPYHNKQEQMMVRRPHSSVSPVVQNSTDAEDPEKVISNILNNLLTYVEIKEIANSVIQDEVVDAPLETETTVEVSPKSKKKVKRKKLDLELRRLNCKVIDVATTEDDVNCAKPFCRLGCVCKSLQCERIYSSHCQLVGCMFGCKCPPEKLKNSLSILTVNHLEDQAKKNLAKVEREFTQTLIHTDNDAILVGTTKMRRSSKPPKKYTDFIGNDFFESSFRISEEEISRAKRSHVVLEKLDLEGVIPLCLYHHSYNCACEGEPLPKLRLVKRKDEKTKVGLDSCARIRKVFSQYKERNRSPFYNQRLIRNFREVTPAPDAPKRTNKRKQSFTIREDFSTEKEFALQRRKKKVKITKYSPVFEGEIKLSLQENKDMLKIIGTENASLEYLRMLPWAKLILSYHSGAIKIWTKIKKSTILFCNTAEHLPPKGFTDIKKSLYKFDIIKWILSDSLPPGLNRDLMHLILTPKSGHFLIAGYCLKKIKETPVDPLKLSPTTSQRFEEINANIPGILDDESDIEVDDNINEHSQRLIDDLVENKAKKLKMIGRDMIKLGTKFDHLYEEKKKQSTAVPAEPEKIKRRKYNDLIKKLNEPVEKIEKENGALPPTKVFRKILPRPQDPLEILPTELPKLVILNTDKPLEEPPSTPQVEGVVGQPSLCMTSKVVKLNWGPSEDPLYDLPQSLANNVKVKHRTKTLKKDDEPKDPNRFQIVPNNINLKKITKTPKKDKAKAPNPLEIVTNNINLENSSKALKKENKAKAPDPFEIVTNTINLENSSKALKKENKAKASDPLEMVPNSINLENPAKTPKEDNKAKASNPLDIVTNNMNLETPTKTLNKETKAKAPDPPEIVKNNINLENSTTTPKEDKLKISEPLKIVPTDGNSKDPVKPLGKFIKIAQVRELMSRKLAAVKPLKSPTPIVKTVKCTLKQGETDNSTQPKTLIETDRIYRIFPEHDRCVDIFHPPNTVDLGQVKEMIAQKRSEFQTPDNTTTFSKIVRCTHKDIYNKTQVLKVTSKLFAKRVLHTEEGEIIELSAALPHIDDNLNWRMIYLNSDFTYLSLEKGKYSIKYTDLMDVAKMACNIEATIILQNDNCFRKYRHPMFGIFCVPEYEDRLFIGPYTREDPDVRTLRYLQGRLVETYLFDKMVGQKVVEKEIFLYEGKISKTIPEAIVIDISDDEGDVVNEGMTNWLTPPFVEVLKAKELQAKRNVNRYVITNIPHLGYFEACQQDGKAIEVYWPTGTKGYRFPNVTFAKNLLTQYLLQIFCPIPQDFKINVIIMTNLEIEGDHPIDTKYFSHPGPFFCGEFGIYEKDLIPTDLLMKCNVPSVDTLLQTHKKKQQSEEEMIRIFGLFLMSNEELRKHTQPEEILKWAKSEIYILKKLCDNYESEKADLMGIIRTKTWQIRTQNVTHISDTRDKNSSETIEIKDSDEEDDEVPTIPVFRKISTSGKIDTDVVFKNNSRSLLKPNVVVKPGHSLLKTTDQRLTLEAKDKSPSKRVKLLSSVVVKKKVVGV